MEGKGICHFPCYHGTAAYYATSYHQRLFCKTENKFIENKLYSAAQKIYKKLAEEKYEKEDARVKTEDSAEEQLSSLSVFVAKVSS